MRVSSRRAAEVAITVQFLALVRTLAEIYRLRAASGAAFGLAEATPYVTGALLAAIGAWVATTCFFLGRFRLASGVVVAAVLSMLGYKLAFIR